MNRRELLLSAPAAVAGAVLPAAAVAAAQPVLPDSPSLSLDDRLVLSARHFGGLLSEWLGEQDIDPYDDDYVARELWAWQHACWPAIDSLLDEVSMVDSPDDAALDQDEALFRRLRCIAVMRETTITAYIREHMGERIEQDFKRHARALRS